MKKEIKIYIDSIDSERIDGWFINSLAPKKNKVLLYLDGQHKATTRANIERQDVAEAHGQLLSGFHFDLTEFSVFNHVQLRSNKGDVLLEVNVEHAEKVERFDKPLISVEPEISSEGKRIYIDSIDSDEIKGWFVNSKQPEDNRVLLYLDGQYKAITQANIEREDVGEAHGQLLSGFVFDLKKFPVFGRVELRSSDKEVLLKADVPRSEILVSEKPYSYEKHRQLEQIKIDLSKPINGENWYDMEPTGRWGGPELESTLNIPALSAGKYMLELAIENEFCGLDELSITFNNNTVETLNTEYQTPVILRAEVQAKDGLSFWRLGFNYPKTTNPSDGSSGDLRELGIFLSAVTLTKITS